MEDTSAIKSQIMNNYLSQQMMEASDNQVQQIELPDAQNMEAFKNQVKTWIDIDNQIKKLQGLTRERNSAKNELTVKILNFMSKYNIEDLNTKDGKLRYKVSQVNKQANRADITERVTQLYGKYNDPKEFLEHVLAPKTEQKHSLRRLGGPKIKDLIKQ